MGMLRMVKTVFKVSSFVLRSAIGGAAVATVFAAVVMKRSSMRKRAAK